jgi:phosphoribosyl 1,2-cyclic phosphate phosphodiesterase
MKVTVLGCGPSGGVPTIDGKWGVCDPDNPKNSRLRPSILIEKDGYVILIDTSPDLRTQLLRCNPGKVDAVFFTHVHADHVMGIDDLRVVRRMMDKNIDVYAAPDVLEHLVKKFTYLFETVSNSDAAQMYKPALTPHEIKGKFSTGPFQSIIPIEQDHGICQSWGFRFDNFAYSTDVVRLDDDAFRTLEGVDTWIVDCLRPGNPHPTHATLKTTLEWVSRVQPRRTILTHMNNQTDYSKILAMLPDGVEPAYDEMVISID